MFEFFKQFYRPAPPAKQPTCPDHLPEPQAVQVLRTYSFSQTLITTVVIVRCTMCGRVGYHFWDNLDPWCEFMVEDHERGVGAEAE